MDYSMETIGLL